MTSPASQPTRLMARLWTFIRGQKTRSVLWWCLPALVAGFALRAALIARMPNAFYHSDSEQLFETYQELHEGSFSIHGKKTWLVPTLYCLPPLLRLPVLPAIAVVQHLVGLATVVVIGYLLAASFVSWRAFVVPVTLIVAVDPVLLWYEHVCLPETIYVFFIATVALTGLLFYKKPDLPRLLALAAALFFTASSRPEGKLFCFFGIALVVVASWADKKRLLQHTALIVLVTLLSFGANRTKQSGSLLYSNIAHLTPPHLRVAPGFAEEHEDYFAQLRQEWEVVPTKIVRERKRLRTFAEDYLEQHRGQAPNAEKLCGRLGVETCLRNVTHLPALALAKFRFSLNDPTAGNFDPSWVYQKQLGAFTDDSEEQDNSNGAGTVAHEFASIVFGRDFQSPAELDVYLRHTYRPFDPDWLTRYQSAFSNWMYAWHLPNQEFGKTIIPGIPVLFLAAPLGLLAMSIWNRGTRAYHLLWLGTLVFMAFVLSLTGTNLGRFRIGFEPFWLLYAMGGFDALWARVVSRLSAPNAIKS